VSERVNTEYWWNGTDRGKQKYWVKHLSLCHFVDHKSHIGWPRIEPVRARRQVGEK
jgi:hypothetical protein